MLRGSDQWLAGELGKVGRQLPTGKRAKMRPPVDIPKAPLNKPMLVYLSNTTIRLSLYCIGPWG